MTLCVLMTFVLPGNWLIFNNSRSEFMCDLQENVQAVDFGATESWLGAQL